MYGMIQMEGRLSIGHMGGRTPAAGFIWDM
jgi:hypothetical protein